MNLQRITPICMVVIAGVLAAATTGAQAAVSPVVVSFSGGVVTITGTNAVDQISIRIYSNKVEVDTDGAGNSSIAPVPLQAGPGCVAVNFGGGCTTTTLAKVRVETGRGDDYLSLHTQSATAASLARPVSIDTGPNDDVVLYSGNEVYGDLALSSGHDIFQVYAGDGHLNVEGGAGSDILDASSSFHRTGVLEGGTGNDTIRGGWSDDFLYGDSGNDTIEGDGGDDTIIGDSGTDKLDGGFGADKVYGGYGNDTIRGGTGDSAGGVGDELRGNSGTDVITSGAGEGSSLYGGEGRDSLDAQNGIAESVISCGEGTTDKVRTDPNEFTTGCEKPWA